MTSPIQILWENNQIFGVEGIVFQDKIIIMNFYEYGEYFYKGIPLCDTTLPEVIKYYPEPSSEVLPNGTIASFPDPNNILEIGVEIQIHSLSPLIHKENNIYFGEGAMGNEGFVALTDANNQLIWSICFNLTNPIISANIEENYLHLLSTNNTRVKINLNKLTDIEIILSKDF